MGETALEKMSAIRGFDKVISDTAAHTGPWESVVVNADAVFSAFKIGGVDMMTTKGLTGITIKAGMYLPTDPDLKITDITLASGSVIPYK